MNLFKDLRDLGLGAGYDQFVQQLEPILHKMGERGMPVSRSRFDEVKLELTRRLYECEKAMQALIPTEVKAHSPKAGYKREPLGAVEGAITTHGKDKEGKPVLCAWGKHLFPGEVRWVKLLPWKPSREGLLRYMRHRKHAIPLNFKTAKETTGEKELVRLAATTKDFLYTAVIQYRQVGTVLNNHMKNWEPGKDERVHPTFYYDTGTGQLASRRPNAQNAPKHGQFEKKEIADLFRSMVIARPNHTLVEMDYRSFHAQTLAFEAQDAAYLRLAKLDIHSYLTAHLVRHPDRDKLLSFPDEELRDRLAHIKQEHRFIRDYKAKRAILGYGFGMGYRKLYNLYQESFENQSDAKRTIDMLNGLFPVANAWRDSIRAKAHEQGYLLSRFGCIRWFWEVYRWANGKWSPGGDDSEAAVAFLPANDAFCHIKLAMLKLEKEGWLKKGVLINQVHDSLMFECPDEQLIFLLPSAKAIMEEPSKVLIDPVVAPGGLSVEVGVSVGQSWDQMKEV